MSPSASIEVPNSAPADTAALRIARNVPALAPAAVSRGAFAASMIALGVLGLCYGDFALVWQRIPIEHLPGRSAFAYAAAAVELVAGAGLLWQRTAAASARVLAGFLLLWVVLLKLPAVLAMPLMEATWLGFGEIAVLLAAGWVLFAANDTAWTRTRLAWAVGARGVRGARCLFAVSLPMIGLSHLVYGAQTAAFIPAWIPQPLAFAYFTGVCSLAASTALLLGVWPRLAAGLEVLMLGAITLIVWAPGLAKLPPDRTQWTAFAISSAIASAAWVVADTYRRLGWRSVGYRAMQDSATR